MDANQVRVAIYARVSSAGQRDRGTIQSQLHALRRTAAARGWTVVGEYLDDGESGKTGTAARRRGLVELLADAEARRFDVVLVVDDRLSRSDDLIEQLEVVGRLKRAGVRLAVGEQVLDPAQFADLLVAMIKGASAAEDNRKRREAFRRGVLRAIEEGGKARGRTPYGLTYEAAGRRWGIHEEQAGIVQEIFARVVAGESARAVGMDLDRRRVQPPGRGRWVAALWRILRSRVYVGEYVPDRRLGAIVRVPAIVDEQLWAAAQAAMARTGRRGLRRTRHVYLCEGLGRCQLCGSLMWSVRLRARESYYVCAQRRRPSPDQPRCAAPFRRIEDVDARVWTAVASALGRPDLIGQLLADRRTARTVAAADVAGAERQLARLAETEAVILDRFSRGQVSQAALDAHLKGFTRRRRFLERQAEAARAQAAAAERPAVDTAELVRAMTRLGERLWTATPAERQRLVRGVVRSVTMGPDTLLVQVAISAEGAGIAQRSIP